VCVIRRSVPSQVCQEKSTRPTTKILMPHLPCPNYRRGVVKEGETLKFWGAGGVDVLKAAQSVQKPTNEMCLRCHAATGGGPNHKHGVIPTKDSDVHVAKGMHCVDCHPTQKHKIGGGSDLKAQDLWDVKVDCTNCHKEQTIHKADATAKSISMWAAFSARPATFLRLQGIPRCRQSQRATGPAGAESADRTLWSHQHDATNVNLNTGGGTARWKRRLSLSAISKIRSLRLPMETNQLHGNRR